MSWQAKGLWWGEPFSVEWDNRARRFTGEDGLWEEVVARSAEPLALTPTGPTLERPNPHLPGHALALLASVARISETTGTFPEYPEGMRASQFPSDPDVVY